MENIQIKVPKRKNKLKNTKFIKKVKQAMNRKLNFNRNLTLSSKPRPLARANILSAEKALNKQAANVYLETLLFPEDVETKGCAKCPTNAIVPPTTSFDQSYVLSVNANASGNGYLAMCGAPSLFNSATNTNFYYNNNVLLNGSGLGTGFNIGIAGLNFINPVITNSAGQSFPMYQAYRPVGMSLQMRYVGAVLNESGYFLSCYSFDTLYVGTLVGVSNGQLDRYLIFSNLRQGTWAKKHMAGAGTRLLYIPLDPTYFSFQRTGVSFPLGGGSGFNLHIAATGFPANAPFEIEVTYHWEALLDINGRTITTATENITHLNTTQQELLLKIAPKIADTDASKIDGGSGTSFFDKIIRWSAEHGPTIVGGLKAIMSTI